MGELFMHIAAVIIGLIYPIIAIVVLRNNYHRIRMDPSFRKTDYKQTIFILWTLTIVGIIGSFGFPDKMIVYKGLNAAAVVFGLLIAAFIIVQWRQKVSTLEAAEGIRERMNGVWDYLPKNQSEYKWFVVLSLSAAICEELLFRYFLFEYLLLYVPAGMAIFLLNLLFALTHTGSGWANMSGAFVLGVIFSIIFYFSGYLILPIILHAAIDINTGFMGFKVTRIIETQRTS